MSDKKQFHALIDVGADFDGESYVDESTVRVFNASEDQLSVLDELGFSGDDNGDGEFVFTHGPSTQFTFWTVALREALVDLGCDKIEE